LPDRKTPEDYSTRSVAGFVIWIKALLRRNMIAPQHAAPLGPADQYR
jgi:hypothetical protein